jgi:hypothetical protein
MCISMLCVVCCVEKEAIPMSKPQHTTDKTYGTGARCTPHYFAHTIILRTPLFCTHHYFAHPIISHTPLFCTPHYFAHTIILHTPLFCTHHYFALAANWCADMASVAHMDIPRTSPVSAQRLQHLIAMQLIPFTSNVCKWLPYYQHLLHTSEQRQHKENWELPR